MSFGGSSTAALSDLKPVKEHVEHREKDDKPHDPGGDGPERRGGFLRKAAARKIAAEPSAPACRKCRHELCLSPFQHAIEQPHQECDGHDRDQHDDDAERGAAANVERLARLLIDQIGKGRRRIARAASESS